MSEDSVVSGGWPSSLESLPSIERFVPPSLQYAKRTAKLLLEALRDKWSTEFRLHEAQKALARAYGMVSWFELEQSLKREGFTPSPFDHELGEEAVEKRIDQQTAAIREVTGIHGKWAYDVACVARLTASPEDRRASRENDTPWGQAQEREEVAPGIVEVSTHSHGGILLSPDRQASMPEHLRLDGAAYEEDCNRALVVAGFPEHFDIVSRAYALAALKVICGRTIPFRRSTSSQHAKFDKDPWNREMTQDEKEVVDYLITCVNLNRKPCVMTTTARHTIEDWSELLSQVPKKDGKWPMQEAVFFHAWLKVLGVGVDESLHLRDGIMTEETMRLWSEENFASPIPHDRIPGLL